MSTYGFLYLLIGLFFIITAIPLYYLGYKLYLKKDISLEKGKGLHWGSFKGFWYHHNDHIFIFLAFLMTLIGLIFAVSSFHF